MTIFGVEDTRELDGLGDTAQEFWPRLPEIHPRLKVHSFTQGPHRTALLDSFNLILFHINGMYGIVLFVF